MDAVHPLLDEGRRVPVAEFPDASCPSVQGAGVIFIVWRSQTKSSVGWWWQKPVGWRGLELQGEVHQEIQPRQGRPLLFPFLQVPIDLVLNLFTADRHRFFGRRGSLKALE